MKKSHPLILPFLALLLAGATAVARADDQTPPPPAPPTDWTPPADPTALGLLPPDKELPPGHHKLLERFTKDFGLCHEQQLWIEPQLHAEESVTKPIIAYKALSQEERKQMMLTIKLAARRQIRVLLTPEQQKLMDQQSETLKATGSDKPVKAKKNETASTTNNN